MKHQQILEKAIAKAIEGGWNMHGIFPGKYSDVELTHDVISGFPTLRIQTEYKGRIWAMGAIPLFMVLFNHDFAKALWGKSGVPSFRGNRLLHPWEAHLQAMVIADDPIKYLGENI